jgi:cobalt-zinc-cadmium efflux system outer membrane protein
LVRTGFQSSVFVASALLALAGCQAPAPRVDLPDQIARQTQIAAPITWLSDGQPLDVAETAADASTLSLLRATQLAVTNSPQLQSALWKVRQAQADDDQQRLWPNPILAMVMRFPEGGGKPALEASLAGDLLAILKLGGTITAADDRLRAASAQALKEAADQVSQAQQTYIAAAIVDEELAILNTRHELLDRLLQTSRARLRAGEGTRLDVTTLEGQAIELEAEIADKEAERADQRLILARIIGRPGGSIDWKLEPLGALTQDLAPERSWVQAGLQHRPELDALRWELLALGEEAQLAKWSLFDPAEIGVASQRDPDWQVGPTLSLPLPIFDTGQAKHDKATAARVAAVHDFVAAQRGVVEEVRRAYAALHAARAAASRTTDQLLPLQEQRRDLAEKAYKAGDSDLATLLLAEDSLQTARFKALELREKAAVARVQLERAVGGRGAAATLSITRPATQP